MTKIWMYEGTATGGKFESGEICASNVIVARANLQSRGINVIKIQASRKESRFSRIITKFTFRINFKINRNSDNKLDEITTKKLKTTKSRKPANLLNEVDVKKLESKVSTHQKVSKKSPATKKEIYVFIRQFAVVIKSGIPLLKAFDIVIRGQENKKFVLVLENIKSSIENGISLTNSFAAYPKVFDALFINFLAIGEQGGILDMLLERYILYIDKVDAVKRKVKSALSYPTVVLIIALIVLGVVLGFVVPSFEKIFTNFGAKLPMATILVIKMSNVVANYWWILLLGAFATYLGFRQLFRTLPNFRYRVEAFVLRLPLFGNLIRKSIISRWSRTLALLFSAGVPLNDSLKSIAIVLNNYVYGAATLIIQRNIENGVALSAALESTNIFPSMVNQMVAVGEESGKLELLLNSVADYYDQDVDLVIDILLSLIEPLPIVILGSLLGGIIIAIYLPIFNLGNVVG